ncbi:MAG: ATP-binding cassette domain-containing protein [Clostridiales bacterium]|nr:ATP-binding cassette domain-containing protein [Clostridiales bacterium]MDY2834683.1 ATP-binding cassette domain-containing protein [Candidatus Aphodomonas sp.]
MSAIANRTISSLTEQWPFVCEWLDSYHFTYDPAQTLSDCIARTPDGYFRDIDRTRSGFVQELEQYIRDISAFLGEEDETVETVSLLPGHDKRGVPEGFSRIDWRAGEVIAIVGATGSGKSRLLADVEWCASGDTPTSRRVLINGRPLGRGEKGKRHIVAQLSQNMNFVIDATVLEFLSLHAGSLRREDPEGDARRAFEMANNLAGETFSADTPLTGLSGGQSRALMIADCAVLSDAPIVLIDEIENAGINRRKALAALTGENKIVLMATHDPVLALLADRRLVVCGGGISAVLEKSDAEKEALRFAEEMDARLMQMREALRSGLRLEATE